MPSAMNEIAQVSKLPKFRKETDGFTRQDVVNAFQQAFQLIGGVNRLTLWANENPGEFYKQYARLLPSATVNFGVQQAPQVIHALRPTALDSHPGQIVDLQTGLITREGEPE